MQGKKPRFQKRAGHAETRWAVLVMALAALVLYPVFHHIRQEKRHLEPARFTKYSFESWSEPWHTLAALASLVALVVVVIVAVILVLAALAWLLKCAQRQPHQEPPRK